MQGADIARNGQGKSYPEMACTMPTPATTPIVRRQHAWKKKASANLRVTAQWELLGYEEQRSRVDRTPTFRSLTPIVC